MLSGKEEDGLPHHESKEMDGNGWKWHELGMTKCPHVTPGDVLQEVETQEETQPRRDLAAMGGMVTWGFLRQT